jgi:hypothetical protein
VGEAALAFALHRVGRHRDDRYAPAAPLLATPDLARRLIAVQLGHLAVHQHSRVCPGLQRLQRLQSVHGDVWSEAAFLEHAHGHQLVDRRVIDHEHVAAHAITGVDGRRRRGALAVAAFAGHHGLDLRVER